MSRTNKNYRKLGEIRPSQLLYTFGVGSITELPNISVMIMGLEDWEKNNLIEITEERLLATVKRNLGKQVNALYTPPFPLEGQVDDLNNVGVPVAPFPRWMYCPQCGLLARFTKGSGIFELKVNPYHPDKTRIVHVNCPKSKKPPTVIPARFLVACKEGHLDDFPWLDYLHQGAECERPILKMYEQDVSGNPSSIWIKCESCGKQRPMSYAFGKDAEFNLPACKGRHPHLRSYDKEKCSSDGLQTVLLGASNSWFPVTLSALSIPTKVNSRLDQLVEDKWLIFKEIQNLEFLTLSRKIVPDLRIFASYNDKELWEAIQKRRALLSNKAENTEDEDLKLPEWRVFKEANSNLTSPNFKLKEVDVPKGFEKFISKVVLVQQLREVRALIGFSRIESTGDLGEENVKRVPLTRKPPQWVPASEVLGEGIFIEFNEEEILKWTKIKEVQDIEEQFFESHKQWFLKRGKKDVDEKFEGIRFILLHSFAHSLMRQLSLECGYTAASIRERIYSKNPGINNEAMSGVLIYTAATDSEGTLGGLVNLGSPEKFGRHLLQSLEKMKLCASDPLCSEHSPHSEGFSLHGAACHACLFSPETSCEAGNKYLDRSVLVPTFNKDSAAYFNGLI